MEVAANLEIPFAFAYYGADGLRQKQIQLTESPEDVGPLAGDKGFSHDFSCFNGMISMIADILAAFLPGLSFLQQGCPTTHCPFLVL